MLLNLEPDHLDRHGTFEAYRDAKLRIFERARANGRAEVERPGGDRVRGRRRAAGRAAHSAARTTARTRPPRRRPRARSASPTSDRARPARRSPASRTGSSSSASANGVRYVNDSKATNVAAALRALAAYADEPVHLILGGSRKGEDFAPLAAAIGPNVRSVYLIGETADELAAALPRRRTTTATSATALAAASTREPGDVVLLSPACASYDQFRDFEQRGEEFRRLVQNLAG